MCFIPHQGLFMRLSFSILLLMASFWWICRYGGYNGKLASHISLSQRPDPKEKQVISLDQDVQVCGYFWCMVDETPLYEFSLPCIYMYIYMVWAIFSPFSLFFDMPCGHVAYLLWVCIFYFFLYSPYIMMITLERDKHGTSWSFICG